MFDVHAVPQKTLVALMRLAQAMQFSQVTDKSCVLLYDDLAAELDSSHRNKILSVLSTMDIQLFLTAIERDQIDLSDWPDSRPQQVVTWITERYDV